MTKTLGHCREEVGEKRRALGPSDSTDGFPLNNTMEIYNSPKLRLHRPLGVAESAAVQTPGSNRVIALCKYLQVPVSLN